MPLVPAAYQTQSLTIWAAGRCRSMGRSSRLLSLWSDTGLGGTEEESAKYRTTDDTLAVTFRIAFLPTVSAYNQTRNQNSYSFRKGMTICGQFSRYERATTEEDIKVPDVCNAMSARDLLSWVSPSATELSRGIEHIIVHAPLRSDGSFRSTALLQFGYFGSVGLEGSILREQAQDGAGEGQVSSFTLNSGFTTS